MGFESNIGWTEATWNPWHGCLKISPGCAKCYMYREKERYGQDPRIVTRSKPATFNAPLKWKDSRLIFTCSWSDWFIREADDWRAEAWDIIRRTPQHRYLILTKRANRIADNLPADWGAGWRHVALGVSVETSGEKGRMNLLRQVPAYRRFLSLEPLLGSLAPLNLAGYHWAIAGGESGSGFRPMNFNWAREVRDACAEQGVPFFFKQDSGNKPGQNAVIDGQAHTAPLVW